MGALRLWVLICAVCVGNTACTATGGIRENFYMPSSQDVQKLPLKVALVTDSAMKSQRLTLRNMMRGDTIEVNLHPGLINAVRGELEGEYLSKTLELMEVFQYVKPNVELVARREFNTEQTPQLLGGTEMLKRGVRLFERAAP